LFGSIAFPCTPRRLLPLGLLGALAIAVLPTTSAKAALISTDACDNATLSQPFAQFGDFNNYKLVQIGRASCRERV